MKRQISIVVVLVIMTILLTGCPTIGPKKNIYEYSPNDELYDYCTFDKSSYWLYEDSITQQIDSVVVTNFYKSHFMTEEIRKEDNLHYADQGYVNSFEMSFDITNLSTGNTYSRCLYPMVEYPNPDYSDVVLKQYEYYYMLNFGYPYLYAYTNISSSTSQVSEMLKTMPIQTQFMPLPYSIEYLAFYENYNVDGHIYRDVKKIEFINKEYTNDTTICYWAKYVGLIRQEVRSDSIKDVKNIKYYNVINVKNQY